MTKVGAMCVRVDDFKMLSKTLKPLPLPKLTKKVMYLMPLLIQIALPYALRRFSG